GVDEVAGRAGVVLGRLEVERLHAGGGDVVHRLRRDRRRPAVGLELGAEVVGVDPGAEPLVDGDVPHRRGRHGRQGGRRGRRARGRRGRGGRRRGRRRGEGGGGRGLGRRGRRRHGDGQLGR